MNFLRKCVEIFFYLRGGISSLSKFRLITENHFSFLSCAPFEKYPCLKHAFSMKLTVSPSTVKPTIRSAFQGRDGHTEIGFLNTVGIPVDSLVTLKQVHGSQCRKIIKRRLKQAQGAEGDCLLTSEHGIALGVRTADCFPVLMFDPERKVISCTHVGWRSLAKRILDDCLELMVKDFSCRPPSIITAIGPGIDKCCYKVKEDVIEEFHASRISIPFFISQTEDLSFSLDLKGIIIDQLVRQGLSRSKIYSAPFCTFCSPLPLPSFRREGKQAGRALSLIMMTENRPSLP